MPFDATAARRDDDRFASAASVFAKPRLLRERASDGLVNVRDYYDAGGLADLTVNMGPAAQAAINFAADTGARGVYWPALPGSARYFLPLSAPSLSLPAEKRMQFVGDGGEATVLKFDEGSSSAQGDAGWHPLFRALGVSAANPRSGRFEFRGLGMEGTLLDAGGRVNVGGPAIAVNYIEAIRLLDCRFYGLAYMATQCEAIRRVHVEGCEFHSVMRDQVRFRSCFNALITGNRFKNSDDDSIALHQASSITGAGLIRDMIVVTNNLFEDTTGIAVLGARNARIAGNVGKRMKLHFIQITPSDATFREGSNPMFDIDVVDNKCYDMLERAPFSAPAAAAITVKVPLPRAGSGDANLIPGSNNPATGAMVPPWNYFANTIENAADAIPPGYGIRVARNSIMRTLPAVAKYSDWGFGPATSNAGFVDPAVNDAALRPVAGIVLGSNIVGGKCTDNRIMHCKRGIVIDAVGAPLAKGLLGQYDLDDNLIWDCIEYGVALFGDAANASLDQAIKLRIRRNQLSLDPYHLSPGRQGTLGAWTVQGTITAIGIIGQIVGPLIEDNLFSDLYAPLGAAVISPKLRRNAVRCHPFVIGAHSTANYGVGIPPYGGGGFEIETIIANASASNWGINSSTLATQSRAMPNAGNFTEGWFVFCTDSSLNVLGWRRMTTGSGHVAGTDWKAVAVS